jgi:hypothetical protein
MPWAEPIKPYEKPAEVVRAEGFVPGTYLVDTLGPLRWTCRLKIFFDDSQSTYLIRYRTSQIDILY